MTITELILSRTRFHEKAQILKAAMGNRHTYHYYKLLCFLEECNHGMAARDVVDHYVGMTWRSDVQALGEVVVVNRLLRNLFKAGFLDRAGEKPHVYVRNGRIL